MRTHCLLAIATTATGVINCLGYSKWLQLQVMLKLNIGSSAAYARGYRNHVCHWIWHLIIGEMLGTTCERENERDRYAVVVLEEDTCYVFGSCRRSCTSLQLFFDIIMVTCQKQ